ncbi:MAG: AraC family transcriptional regulator ligand-binding domain-containing protein [Pseudomonadota bacterium]
MNTPAHLLRPTIAIAYLQLLVEMLAERGIPSAALFAGLPVNPALLAQPEARMSGRQWTLLLLRALELTGDPGLGYAYGLRMRPTVHGVLGYATMTCTTMRQALEIAARYMRVRQAHFSLQLVEERGLCRLELREKFPIPVLRRFFCENILLGMVRGNAVLLGRDVADFPDMEIHVDWPEPEYHRDWAARLPRVKFSQPVNALCFPLSYLEQRPVLADPHASQQAIAMCERELALAAGAESDIVTRVRAVLQADPVRGYPKLEEVAERLHLSGRSLKRHLQQSGTSFLLLLEETRRRDAHALLANSDLPVQDVAARLGYLNPANFSRAFNQWTGEPPSRYRERLRSGS